MAGAIQHIHGQDPSILAGFQWRSLGPAVAGGRVTDIEVVPGTPSQLYVGSASGGVFLSRNHGITWEPILDAAENISVGDIALAPSDPLEVWVGTGEANNRNSSPWGAGVYRSSDGGKTWRFMGLEETRHIGRIVVHPTDPMTVWVAALGHLWGPNAERGIYKTSDGGETWRKVLFIDENTGFVDLARHPADPDVLYAAAYQRRRRAWGFVGGGPGSGIYRSMDGGVTWHQVSQGLPEGDKGRIGLTVWARNPNLVVAIVQAREGGIYQSDDQGESWEKVNSLNPRAMYYSQIRIDPNDDQRIYVLGTQLHRSTDGGKTFTEMPMELEYNTGVHVDHHDLWIDPRDSRHMVLGNDGGLYYTFDGGENWLFTANLPIQQFYDISLDTEDPYRIYGGLQDNNSYRGPSATRRYHGILNRDWIVVDYGDGMTNQADPTDSRIAYVSSQGGAIIRLDTRTLDRKDIQPFTADTVNQYRFYWTAPMLLSPHSAATVYLGGNRLFTSRDRGVSWEMTEDLSRGVSQDSLEIMGILTDSTTLARNDGAATYGVITTVAESPARSGILWVGTDDGNVQVSKDGGETWTEVSGRIPDLPHPMFVSRVAASHHVAGRAYVSFDGHWDDDYGPYLYVTEDFGQVWRSLARNLESATVNVITEHPDNQDLLFVGAEDGIFASLDRGSTWLPFNNNMPRVPVDDIEIHARENDLVAGTHGRGIWILDDVRALAGLTSNVRQSVAHIFTPRNATLFQYNTDVPSQGQGIFIAPNPPFGAMLDFWLSQELDDARLNIRDSGGKTVRTMPAPGKAGFNRVTWDLRYQPLPHDTTRFQVPSLDVGPRGPMVMPGQYSVELLAAGQVLSSTELQVRWDPLKPMLESEIRARHDFTMALYELQQIGYHASVQADEVADVAREAMDTLKSVEDVPAGTPRDSLPEELAIADSLRSAIADVASELRRRNNDLRGWWRGLIGKFAGGPSVIGSMTGPTRSQEERLEWTRVRLREAVQRLDEAIRETVPALNRILAEKGTSTVEVPQRGSGVAAH
jgi:photosystem II stability/assembly factor-like uncharacterized protein